MVIYLGSYSSNTGPVFSVAEDDQELYSLPGISVRSLKNLLRDQIVITPNISAATAHIQEVSPSVVRSLTLVDLNSILYYSGVPVEDYLPQNIRADLVREVFLSGHLPDEDSGELVVEEKKPRRRTPKPAPETSSNPTEGDNAKE